MKYTIENWKVLTWVKEFEESEEMRFEKSVLKCVNSGIILFLRGQSKSQS